MKSENKSTKNLRNIDSLMTRLAENELLNTLAMSQIRGGDGEGDGGGEIIIIPPPPKII
jgi:hypothetical protein